MKVLFTTLAANAHLYNLVPMAWALRAAGHDVRIAAQPDLTDAIVHTGLPAVAAGPALDLAALSRQAQERPANKTVFGSEFDITETREERLTPDYVRGVFTTWCSIGLERLAHEAVLDDLVGFARAWQPDLVVWDALTYMGPIAARASGAAHVRMLFGLDHWARLRDRFFALGGAGGGDPMAEWLSGKLDRYGCTFDEELVLGQRTLDPLPPWTRFPVGVDYLPVRQVPYNGPSVVPAWLSEPPARRRVCVTLGMSRRDLWGEDRFSVDDLFDAVAGLDVEVVATLTAKQVSAASAVPDNVRLFDFVPLDALLPTCAAVVHHGGAGTTGNAVAHGVPQLVIPGNMWDKAGLADLLAGQGAGLVLDHEQVTAAGLRAQLVRLLEEPSFAASAEKVRAEVEQVPTPARIVPELERLVQD
ncbi:glycosyl transferase [Amycolatopsis sp. NBRC 101858]|uniref:activator-dependent family glycosyltransferase n=1 Tax=Amycolatopsis sp. NBRC 101858 TaxID=3032200 RepID=UPI0024A49E0E|nr:activator-dependent family glycosyltransferase [Amycolatopsis sp. NBRC 101858]GLY37988.1 glycosyl transferase [Amycolatopsis sp. NBRC 101858]